MTQPRDRQRLLSALAGLQTVLGDGLPDHVPDTLSQWLGLIRLDSYYPTLVAQVSERKTTRRSNLGSVCLNDEELLT